MKNNLEPLNTKSIVKTLENLMNKVTEEKCTPDTVNAACNCATKITDILRLHLEVHKLSLRKDALK